MARRVAPTDAGREASTGSALGGREGGARLQTAPAPVFSEKRLRQLVHGGPPVADQRMRRGFACQARASTQNFGYRRRGRRSGKLPGIRGSAGGAPGRIASTRGATA